MRSEIHELCPKDAKREKNENLLKRYSYTNTYRQIIAEEAGSVIALIQPKHIEKIIIPLPPPNVRK